MRCIYCTSVNNWRHRIRRSLGAAMVYSEYTKRRILFHKEVGLGVSDIISVLMNVTKSGVWHLKTTTLQRRVYSGNQVLVGLLLYNENNI